MKTVRRRWLSAALVALVALSSLAAAAADETVYSAVFMDSKKVGHATHRRVSAGGKVTTSHTMTITLKRGEVPITIRESGTTVETAEGKPLSFSNVMDMGLMATGSKGTIGEDGRLTLTTTTGGVKRQETIDWPEGSVLSEGARLIQLKKGLKEGATYTITLFEPSSQQPMDTTITVGTTRNVDLLGRVVPLTEMTAVTKLGTGIVRTTHYVDANIDTQKSITQMMGIKLEIVTCTRRVALSRNEELDLFRKILLTCPGAPGNLRQARSATYTITPEPGAKLTLPQTDNQTVRLNDDGTITLTVRPAAAPSGAGLPYNGTDKTAMEALKPSRFVQSSDKAVVALSRRAVGSATAAAAAARRIESFVHKYIKQKSFSVGYASATEVVAGREGDCTEHAVLAAALCRAAGIPARVVVGMTFAERFGPRRNVFVPHEWNMVFIGGTWVGLDAALGQFDAGHIALSVGSGDPDEFFDTITILGHFKITGIKAEPPPSK